MAQQLSALAALAEDLRLVLSTHEAVHSHLNSIPRVQSLSFWPLGTVPMWCICIHAAKMLIYLKSKIFKGKNEKLNIYQI